jgi:DNA-binding response OmpR family regulator
VLVVEDDPTARRAIACILRRQGYAVSEAATLAQALAELGAAATRPDWVLLDIMLPDGCGTDVIRRAREGASGGTSKVCVITGCGGQLLGEVRALEPEHVFTKPVNVEGLLLALGRDDATLGGQAGLESIVS